ncbi:hypothetical protein Aduo_005248 [Ancylostoma duodenale]
MFSSFLLSSSFEPLALFLTQLLCFLSVRRSQRATLVIPRIRCACLEIRGGPHLGGSQLRIRRECPSVRPITTNIPHHPAHPLDHQTSGSNHFISPTSMRNEIFPCVLSEQQRRTSENKRDSPSKWKQAIIRRLFEFADDSPLPYRSIAFMSRFMQMFRLLGCAVTLERASFVRCAFALTQSQSGPVSASSALPGC